MRWMQRLKHAFRIDIETCQRCTGTLRLIAIIEDPELIRLLLEHLEAASRPRPLPRRPGPHRPHALRPEPVALRSLRSARHRASEDVRCLVRRARRAADPGERSASPHHLRYFALVQAVCTKHQYRPIAECYQRYVSCGLHDRETGASTERGKSSWLLSQPAIKRKYRLQ